MENKENKYIKFTEENDSEGETWDFYIPVEGNMEAIKLLDRCIASEEAEDEYCIDLLEIPENEVDILCKHTRSGYYDYENKLEGILRLPDISDSELMGQLYKGGIKDFVIK
jgi:hypothetical protein